jgi:hypothetical protein
VRGKWVCTKKIIVKREYSITLIIICTYSWWNTDAAVTTVQLRYNLMPKLIGRRRVVAHRIS